MSQGGSVPRPPSRHTSQSPATEAAEPPIRRLHAHQDVLNNRSIQDTSTAVGNEGSERGRQTGHRSSGVHNILNPVGPQPAAGEGSPRPAMGTDQYGAEGSPSRPYALPGQGVSTPHSTSYPPTASPVAPPSSADRGSPVHPYPLAARRILTPKSPRAVSLSRAALRTVEPHHMATLPAPTPRSSELASIAGPPLGGPTSYHGPLPPSRPTSGLSRSLSQPTLGQGYPLSHHREQLQSSSLKREHTGQSVLPGPSYNPPIPTSRAPPPSSAMNDGRWSPAMLGQLPPGGPATRNLHISEGQTLLTITPRHGEEIVVPVDVHQASKQADEKRQRNAGASARFRQRKKEREREQQAGLQKLETRNRDLERRCEELEKHCQDLELERDHYRNERNRLREIVSQTPSISGLADRGPPSPPGLRNQAGFTADSGPHPAHQSSLPPSQSPYPQQSQGHPHSPYSHGLVHPHPRPTPYADPSHLEPPLRRRRTDSEPQMPTSSYSLTTSTTLPPIPGPPIFGIPPSPHITPPPGPSRLPPLRFDQARPASTTPPPVPSGPPAPTIPPPSMLPYPPYRKSSYETAGWATEHHGSTEGSQR
ncbi:hypothetical protein QBC35DRAFT_110813 [Podospora australis]|uniref:BZIP domain-containing protein n=1 Tax=Podospora australis TaxID=1536484 RepID=A0AAN6WXK7_9PEZI|nr:hypothetical protein QBC35DRAFT_110813 [Podospora australis]